MKYRLQGSCSTAIIPPPSFQEGDNRENSNQVNCAGKVALPYVILWNPVCQFPLCSETLKVCSVDGCGNILHFYGWTNGCSSGKQPRILHDINNVVLLVSAIYQCNGNPHHMLYSTDPQLLKQINPIWIPFHLLHRTGFTHSFVKSVTSLVSEGLPLQMIECHIKKLREKHAQEIELQLNSILSSHGQVNSPSSHISLITRPFPSNDIIARCFTILFQQNENLYSTHMMNLEVSNCIRLDHTFKVASNIGYLRPDGKWVTLYTSIFIVLNKAGQTIAWQFVKSNSLDEVKPLLISVKQRMTNTNKRNFTIYVDNCCNCQAKLKAIFGESVMIKLDVFHAVQRVTRVLSKKHTLFLPCINDFKMVFRSPSDIGKTRQVPTPSCGQLLSNLEIFITKWLNAEYDNSKIITDKVLAQIDALKVHIYRRCLSNIEVGGGTNLNEALHRSINPHFKHAGRIGLPLAFALLSILFYTYNLKKSPSNEESITTATATASVGTQSMSSNSSPFGIIQKEISQFQNLIISNIDAIANIDESIIFELEEGDCIIPTANIECIIKNALCSVAVAKNLRSMSKNTPTFSYRMMPFMSEVPYMYFHSLNNESSDIKVQHDKRLADVLKGWGVMKQPMEGDGNCCFNAVAFSLISNNDNLSDPQKDLLKTRGIDVSMDIEKLSATLRKLVVAEWKQNESIYQDFAPRIIVNEEAEKFLSSGFYHEDLADTMILALANVLQSTIIVFSSIECHPVFCITPRVQTISIPFMVVFIQYGSGHYDGVLISPDADNSSTGVYKCSCGKNDKTIQEHCIEIKSKYTTQIRCKCLKYNKGCHSSCYCKNCSNPLGRRLSGDTPPRKRQKHEWLHTNSYQFGVYKGEDVSSGPLTMLEFFTFENILMYCEEEGIDQTPLNIIQIYNQILMSVKKSETSLPLFFKTTEEASSFIKMHQKLLETFNILCKNQFDWNACKELTHE